MTKLTGINRFSEVTGLATAVLIVPSVAIITYEVVMRYAFNAPTDWAHSVTTLLTAITYILGGAYALQSGDFIRVTYVYDKLPTRMKRFVTVISDVLIIYWGVVLVYASYLQAYRSVWRFRGGEWRPETTGTGWDVPIPALAKTVLVLGAILLSLQAIAMLANAMTRRDNSQSPDAAAEGQLEGSGGADP